MQARAIARQEFKIGYFYKLNSPKVFIDTRWLKRK